MRDHRGAITLEAAIIVPVFGAAVLAVIMCLHIAALEITLQHAVDEAVQQMAVASYSLTEQLEPSLQSDDVQHALHSLLSRSNEHVLDFVLLFVPGKAHGRWLHKEALTIEQITVPNIGNGESMIGIVVRYEFPVALPFVRQRIVIRKAAFERIWIGAG